MIKLEDTTTITAKCFNGEPASCSQPCPFRLDVRTFLERIKTGKWNLAYKILRNAVVFPGIVCEVCPAPCRDECQRIDIGDEAVRIRDLEAACVHFAKNTKPESFRLPPKEQSVCIIGAGLSGLSLSLDLAQKKYAVTIFDSGSEAGGRLIREAIMAQNEAFAERIRTELSLQFSAVDTNLRFGTTIKSLDDPLLSGYDAICVCTGKDGESFGLLDGWDAKYFTTAKPGVFLTGELCGLDQMSAIASSAALSKYIETYFMTGSAVPADADGSSSDERIPVYHLDHSNKANAKAIEPAETEKGYTAEEATLEALRCFGCDCRNCFEVCEMLDRYKKRPQKIAIEAYADTKAMPPFVTSSLTRETYSCNICGKCKEVCPVDVDLPALFIMARDGKKDSGKYPRAFHDFWLRDFAWHDEEGSFFNVGKGAEAELYKEPAGSMTSKSKTGAYMFFPGCKLGERFPPHVFKAAELLKDEYGAGVLLNCCGAPLYWAGEAERFRSHIKKLRDHWEAAGKPIFVFACAYCMKVFDEFIPEIEKISIYEMLAENQIKPENVSKNEIPATSYALFDPCTARDFPGMETAAKTLAERAGFHTKNLPIQNRCCGFGGHMRVANPSLYDTIIDHRSEASDSPYFVYCANCADSFKLEGKPHMHILDLYFGKPSDKDDSLQRRRENAMTTKMALSKIYGREISEPVQNPWDSLRVFFPKTILAEMDRRLILEDDIREAIYKAELDGNVFIREGGAPDGGELRQCRLIRQVIVYWVQYIKRNNDPYDYEIIDAWNHRMHFSENE